MRWIGLDLTDPYAKRPRAVDVAVVEDSGKCSFTTLPAVPQAGSAAWLSSITKGPASGDVLIIDGPLGLAAAGRSLRQCERLLGAAGKTPDSPPTPGSRPFAGYVRGSVDLAEALLHAGWIPATDATSLASATMLEAYPGGTWKLFAGGALPHKTTSAGQSARASLLAANGLSFAQRPTNHDQMDAALCAWLGWRLAKSPSSVVAVGDFSSRSSGRMREGVILQVGGTGLRSAASPGPGSPRTIPTSSRSPPTKRATLPPGVAADWLYFATDSRANQWETADLALKEGIICRPARNSIRALVANVAHVQPGDLVLLAYGVNPGQYEAIGTFEVSGPTNLVSGTSAVQRIGNGPLAQRLAYNYEVDPVEKVHTGFLVEPVWTPNTGTTVSVVRPAGNNTIWRV